MSFASRIRAKFTGEQVAPLPAVVPQEQSQPLKQANNDNNFVPTKYGEELPNAMRTFLPRASGTVAPEPAVAAIPDITSEEMFPTLGGAPKTNTSMRVAPKTTGWAAKARVCVDKDRETAEKKEEIENSIMDYY